MNCRIGDGVRFLNDVGGGVVTRIIDRDTVGVTDADGFEMPVLAAEVIVVRPAADEPMPTASPLDPPASDAPSALPYQGAERHAPRPTGHGVGGGNAEGGPPSLLIALAPTSSMAASDWLLHIINDCSYAALYTVGRWAGAEVVALGTGRVLPYSSDPVARVARQELDGAIWLHVQAAFYKGQAYAPQSPLRIDLPVHPKLLAEPLVAHRFLDRPALLLPLPHADRPVGSPPAGGVGPAERVAAKDAPGGAQGVPASPRPAPPPGLEEVDLHIHELVEHPGLLSPAEILEVQMARFRVALDGAIRGKTRRMVFIHGVGNGTLKREVRRALDQSYPKLRYQDASFREYGYGATLVFIR